MLDGYVLAFNFITANPMAIVVTLTGLLLGIIFGALPGLSGTVGVAILTPLTFTIHPTNGIVFLAALYVGSAYGGAITAILFNIPGSPEAACTALDGYTMAKSGRAGKALGTAVVASAEVRWSKNPKLYGTGIINGVAAPECANNTAAACSIPVLALGLPGSATTAVMMGGLTAYSPARS